jgi:hypothetical protein
MQLIDNDVSGDVFSAEARGTGGVNNLREFAVERLRQKEKTKRILIIGELCLVAFAISIMLFAPNEREKVAYIIGAILLVLALGAIGASKFVFKFFGISVDTRNVLTSRPHTELSDCESKYDDSKDSILE